MGLVDAANAGLFASRVPANVTMSPSDAYRAGLIDVYGPPADSGRITVETPGQIGLVDAMRRGRDQSQEMTSPDAQAMRQGFRNESAARRLAGTVRAAGRAGGAKEVVASILGESAADAASGRRVQEARVTPAVVPGVGVLDTLTGKFYGNNQGKTGSISDEKDSEILDKLVKHGRPKAVTWRDLPPDQMNEFTTAQTAKDLPRMKEILEKAADWTPDNQQAYALYEQEARRRGLLQRTVNKETDTNTSSKSGVSAFFRR
jgi:hypothetical protein